MKRRYLRRPKVTANDDGSVYIQAQSALVFIEPGAELDRLIRDLQRVQRQNAKLGLDD